jgi:hypothetical protein
MRIGTVGRSPSRQGSASARLIRRGSRYRHNAPTLMRFRAPGPSNISSLVCGEHGPP